MRPPPPISCESGLGPHGVGSRAVASSHPSPLRRRWPLSFSSRLGKLLFLFSFSRPGASPPFFLYTPFLFYVQLPRSGVFFSVLDVLFRPSVSQSDSVLATFVVRPLILCDLSPARPHTTCSARLRSRFSDLCRSSDESV